MERMPPLFVAAAHISTFLNQQLHHLGVAVTHSKHERRVVRSGLKVDVSVARVL